MGSRYAGGGYIRSLTEIQEHMHGIETEQSVLADTGPTHLLCKVVTPGHNDLVIPVHKSRLVQINHGTVD